MRTLRMAEAMRLRAFSRRFEEPRGSGEAPDARVARMAVSKAAVPDDYLVAQDFGEFGVGTYDSALEEIQAGHGERSRPQ